MFVFRFQEILGIHLPFWGVRGGRSVSFPTFEALSLSLSLLCVCVGGGVLISSTVPICHIYNIYFYTQRCS